MKFILVFYVDKKNLCLIEPIHLYVHVTIIPREIQLYRVT